MHNAVCLLFVSSAMLDRRKRVCIHRCKNIGFWIVLVSRVIRCIVQILFVRSDMLNVQIACVYQSFFKRLGSEFCWSPSLQYGGLPWDFRVLILAKWSQPRYPNQVTSARWSQASDRQTNAYSSTCCKNKLWTKWFVEKLSRKKSFLQKLFFTWFL